MKRILLFLSLVFVFGLVACGKQPPEPENIPEEPQTIENTASPTVPAEEPKSGEEGIQEETSDNVNASVVPFLWLPLFPGAVSGMIGWRHS